MPHAPPGRRERLDTLVEGGRGGNSIGGAAGPMTSEDSFASTVFELGCWLRPGGGGTSCRNWALHNGHLVLRMTAALQMEVRNQSYRCT
eukprot:347388-Chlamydomonas_euryale.AAC.1